MEGICPGPRGYTPAPYEKCHGILVLSYDSIFAFSANIFPNPSTALLLSKWQTTQAYANVLTRADSKFSFDSPLKPHNQATDQQNIQFLLAPRQNQSLKSVSYSKPPLPVTKCNQNHERPNPPVFRASQLLCSDTDPWISALSMFQPKPNRRKTWDAFTTKLSSQLYINKFILSNMSRVWTKCECLYKAYIGIWHFTLCLPLSNVLCIN